MAIKYELRITVQHCFVCRDSENLKMKTFITIALILTFSVAVLCEFNLPFCRFTDDQMAKFLACQGEKIPSWFGVIFNRCKEKHFPHTSYIEIMRKICEGGKTVMEFIMCYISAYDLIQDELKKIEQKCLREVMP
ncbi:uncharacterized protein LOC111086033 [Limulus polyphemus]|uniref:Uncharacterized protein LOC111086033 n=1 Tax=Limulus polyphemus TaxID=6850 RepID=A0ABM1SHE0_LIMPO|nr:uncharacterized protein LOC111086033 [Limulus polyphemus]